MVVRDPIVELLFRDRPGTETCPWRPCADIYRTRQGWLIKLDLAGVRREEIEVGVCGSMLVVSGSRRDWLVEEAVDHYRMEIAYSSFERRFDLPCEWQSCRISTEYRDGMLLVQVFSQS